MLKRKGKYRVRAIYADTDAMGVVYHANYLKWFERGRVELLREMGIVYADFESGGYGIPVTKMGCHYLLPARYDDLVVIETEISAVGRASIRFDYVIRDEKEQLVLARGFTLHPFTNTEGKIIRVPKYITDRINGEG